MNTQRVVICLLTLVVVSAALVSAILSPEPSRAASGRVLFDRETAGIFGDTPNFYYLKNINCQDPREEIKKCILSIR